jgi:hypothetical protein
MLQRRAVIAVCLIAIGGVVLVANSRQGTNTPTENKNLEQRAFDNKDPLLCGA